MASTYAPHAFARTDRSRLGLWWWTTDRVLMGALVLLIGTGVALSFGSSPAAAARTGFHDPFHFAVRQCLYGALGLGLLVGVSTLSPKGTRRVAFFTYLAAMFVMLVLPLIGHSAKGANRWIQIGGFSLQPSEFMKPALVVLASWMFAEAKRGQGVPGVSIAFGLYAAAVALLLAQPDIGQTVLVTVVFGACFFMAGVPMKWIAILSGVAVSGFVAIYFLFDHVAARFHTFLVHGGGDKHDNDQVGRAAQAIAHGGLIGVGPGEGIMKRLVPDLHTDFIYSVAAEEYGYVFSLGLIAVFALVVGRGLYRAMKLSDPFEQVAASGLFVLLGLQTLINVMVNLGRMPTKGMTLPFISYGGSSMLAMGLTMGLALALVRRRPGAYAAFEGPARAGAALP